MLKGFVRILLVGAVGQVVAEDSELDRWVQRWADRTEMSRFHSDFVSRTDWGDVRKGTWDFRLRPSLAQYVAFELSAGGRFTEERVASWNLELGVGKNFVRSAESVRGSGTTGPRPPPPLGGIVLPSCPAFFFVDDRSIPEYMELVKTTVRTLGGNTNDVAVFLEHPELPNVLTAYRLDRRRPQPVVDQRVYMRSPVLPEGRKLPENNVGKDIELPESFRDSFLFVMTKVLRSVEVSGRWLPAEWRVIHGLGRAGHETTISLVPESIVIDGPVAEHGYDFAWPAGTSVYDSFRGKAYSADSSGEEVSGHVTTEARLDEILARADFPLLGTGSRHGTGGQLTNCAANALYLSFAMLGRARPLSEIVEGLGVREERQDSTMADLVRVCRSQGEVCEAIRSDRSLLERVSTRPTLLHVRLEHKHGDQIHPTRDHYYVVDSYEPKAGTVRVFDAPWMPYRARLADVERVWTKNALVFGQDAVNVVSRAARVVWWQRAVLYVVGCAALLASAALVTRRWRDAKARSVLLLFLSLLVFGISGCGRARDPKGGVDVDAVEAGVEVIGGGEVNLGRIKWRPESVWHTFALYNTTPRPVKIKEINKNCTCLDVDFPSEELSPGAQMEIKMGLDIRGAAGPTNAEAALVFDDPNVKHVHLRLSAQVEREYRVHLKPLVWQLPATPKPGGSFRKTLVVHEFLSYDAGELEETSVGVLGDHLRVVSLGPWRKLGTTVHGYARTAELTVEYDPPKKGAFLKTVALAFRHRAGADEDVEAREFRCDVGLKVRR